MDSARLASAARFNCPNSARLASAVRFNGANYAVGGVTMTPWMRTAT
jgi:hypothetical protein